MQIVIVLGMPGEKRTYYTAFEFQKAFEVGQVKAHAHHGLGASAISRILLTRDGKNKFSIQGVADILDKLEDEPTWRGEREEGSGRPRETTKQQDKTIVNFVLKWRGKKKVTVAVIMKNFAWLRAFGNTLVEERLGEAGLEWLRRRRKTLVESRYIPGRLKYCDWVKHRHQATLDLWAYSDGTVFYLDKTEMANEHTQRRAIGGYVWRYSDCRDALTRDCVGPSSYNKAQGLPVRIWGLLANGILHIKVLDEGVVMNEEEYVELIDDDFSRWMGPCRYLVQDFERCLRCRGSRHALQSIGLELIEQYPVASQDFNAIENAWKFLRDRLAETLPKKLELRYEFVQRLKQAVSWINKRKKNNLIHLSRNQKERCQECIGLEGARTSF